MANSTASWQARQIPAISVFAFTAPQVSNGGAFGTINATNRFEVTNPADYVITHGPGQNVQPDGSTALGISLVRVDTGANVVVSTLVQRLSTTGEIRVYPAVALTAGEYDITMWAGGGASATDVQVEIREQE